MNLHILGLLGLLVSGCVMPDGARGSAPNSQGISSSSDPTQGGAAIPGSDWATPFLGAAATLTIAERPYIVPGSGSLSSRWKHDIVAMYLPDASPLPFAVENIRQLDVYVVGHALALGGGRVTIGVLHGVPAWLDPARPYPEGDPQQFMFWRQLAGGVRAYKHRRGNDETTLFTLPASSTWIVATEPAAERIGVALSSGPMEPPFLTMTQGSIQESAGTKDQILMQNAGYLPNFDRAVGGGTVQYPPNASGQVLFANKTIYSTPGDAAFAADAIRRRLATGGLNPTGRSDATMVDAQAVGRVLLVMFRLNQ